MAKQSGLGDNLYVSGYDVSGDVGALGSINTQRGLQDVTGINKSAMERLGLLVDGELSFNTFFNDAATYPIGAHQVFKTFPAAGRIACYFRGTTLGNPVFALTAAQATMNYNRAADGSLLGDVQLQLSNGEYPDWGRSLTAGKRTDTTATNGAGVDHSVATVSGAVAYLQAFKFAGTSVTAKVQSSTDDGSTDPYADVTGLTFTAISADTPTAERVATAAGASIERWLRAVTTGTFTEFVFAVAVAKRLP